MKKLDISTRMTIQLAFCILLMIFGCILLMMGFWVIPLCEVSPSVLTAFGEISAFAGACIGIDYNYKSKIIIDKNRQEYDLYREEKDKQGENQPG